MYKKLLFTIILSCVFSGCINEQSTTAPNKDSHNDNGKQVASTEVEQSNVAMSTEEQSLNKVVEATNKQLTLIKDKKKKLTKLLKERGQKSLITLNGGKFTLHSESFGKGSKVYNTQMREYGLVKGSIVVVSLKPTSAEALDYSNVGVVKIAKNTFSLSPDNTVELMAFYKSLIKSKRFSVVEMQIDYSPIKETAAY
jgi:hypothetical protein